jgi:hypothetical protein
MWIFVFLKHPLLNMGPIVKTIWNYSSIGLLLFEALPILPQGNQVTFIQRIFVKHKKCTIRVAKFLGKFFLNFHI